MRNTGLVLVVMIVVMVIAMEAKIMIMVTNTNTVISMVLAVVEIMKINLLLMITIIYISCLQVSVTKIQGWTTITAMRHLMMLAVGINMHPTLNTAIAIMTIQLMTIHLTTIQLTTMVIMIILTQRLKITRASMVTGLQTVLNREM